MDPHKPGLNQTPPPAHIPHNMSQPPQHNPAAHGMQIGQPMPRVAGMPQSYPNMNPRPAHSASQAPTIPSKPNNQPNVAAVAPGMGPKPAHPPTSAAIAKLQTPGMQINNPSQEKPGMGGLAKPVTMPVHTIPQSIQSASKNPNIPSLIGMNKNTMHMQQQHQGYSPMSQMQQQQRQIAHMLPQQPMVQQNQQMPASMQPIVSQQQQQMPSIPSQQQQSQHSHAMPVKTAVNTNMTNSAPKAEVPKGQTLPVPGLISLSESQPMPPTSTKPVQVTSAVSGQSSSTESLVTVAPVNKVTQNNVTAPLNIPPTPKQPATVPIPTQKPTNIPPHVSSTQKPVEPQKPATNLSITPSSRLPQAVFKPQAPKTPETSNTVTITPSVKSSEPEKAPTNILEQAIQSTISVEPNLNGVSGNKPAAKPVVPNPNQLAQHPVPVNKAPVVEAAATVPSPPPVTSQKSGSLPFPSKSPQRVSPMVPKTSPVRPSNQAAGPQVSPRTTSPSKVQPVSPNKNKLESTVAAKTTPSAVVEESQLPKKETATPVRRGRKPANKSPVVKAPVLDDDDEEDSVEETPTKKRVARNKRKVSETPSEGERKSKRSRAPAAQYQSPISDVLPRATKNLLSTPRTPQEKLILFFKNEHVALRNAEGTFYLCQIAQNVFKNTKKIKIRWLSPIDESDAECEKYKHDYYDVTDFDCILTSIALQKAEKGIMRLSPEEKKRILSILQRALDKEQGISPEKADLDEDHPDGLDISLYNDEAQLQKRKRRGGGSSHKKRKRSSAADDSSTESESDEEEPEMNDEPEDSEPEEEEEEQEDDDEPPKKVARTPAGGRRPRKAPEEKKEEETKEAVPAVAEATPKRAPSKTPAGRKPRNAPAKAEATTTPMEEEEKAPVGRKPRNAAAKAEATTPMEEDEDEEFKEPVKTPAATGRKARKAPTPRAAAASAPSPVVPKEAPKEVKDTKPEAATPSAEAPPKRVARGQKQTTPSVAKTPKAPVKPKAAAPPAEVESPPPVKNARASRAGARTPAATPPPAKQTPRRGTRK